MGAGQLRSQSISIIKETNRLLAFDSAQTMKNKNRDQLQEILQSRAKSVLDDALLAEGEISAKQIDDLERLARLVEINKAVQPDPSRKRWPVIVALIGTLVIVSILLFARRSKTEIELDITATEVGLQLSKEQVLFSSMEISSLGISGLREIHFPRYRGQAAETIRATDDIGSNLKLSTISDEGSTSAINLATLKLPDTTRIRINSTKVSRQYRLSLKGEIPDLQADVIGQVRILVSGGGVKEFNSSVPKLIDIQPESDAVDLDITFPKSSREAFSTQLAVQELDLFRVDVYPGDKRTIVRPVSTVLGGSIFFEELNGQERKLRRGEGIRFKESHGEIRTLQPYEDHLILRFHGHVRGMKTGSIGNGRSLMPTYLEWLRARHSLSLLWGTSLYIFSLIVGILRWWRRPV